MTVEELITSWGFEIDDAPIEQLTTSLDRVQTSVQAIGKMAIASAGAIFGMAKFTADAGEEALKASKLFGISIEAFQELGYAAKLENVDIDTLRMSFVHLSRSVVEASTNFKSGAAQAFSRLGVSVRDANGNLKGNEQLLNELADGFKRLQSPMLRVSLAQEIFGRSATKMVGFLSKGSAGISQLRKEARDLGYIFTNETAEASDDFNDNLDRLIWTFTGVRNAVGSALLGPLNQLMTAFLEWLKVNKEWLSLKITETFNVLTEYVGAVWVGLKGIAATLRPIINLFGSWGNVVKVLVWGLAIFMGAKLLIGLGGIATAVYGIVTAWTAWNSMILITQALTLGWLAAIGAAIVGVVLVIDDIIAFFQGRDSFTGVLVNAVTELWNKFDGFFNSLSTGWQVVIALLATPVRIVMGMLDQLMAVWNLVTGKSTISDFTSGIAKGFEKMIGIGSLSGGARAAFGFEPTKGGIAGPAGALGPVVGGGNRSNNQVNNIQAPITVNVGNNASPFEVGKAVGNNVDDVMGNILRGTMRIFEVPQGTGGR